MADPTSPLDTFSDADPETPPADEFAWVTPPKAEPSAVIPPATASSDETPVSKNEIKEVIAETHAFDQGRAYEDGREFARGTTDGRYEPVGVNRRLVTGVALAFVALVLLALMLVTGDDGDERVVADAPIREAAQPEFIDRPTAPPTFADPDPFVYEEPPYQPAPGGGPAPVDPYAPPPYVEPSYAPYSAPYEAGPDPQQAPPAAAPPVDPRRERYLRARSSALMVDGAPGALSVGGRSAGASAAVSSAGAFAVRPRTSGSRPAEDVSGGRSPDQQAAYDALSPERRAAVDEAFLMMRAVGAGSSPAVQGMAAQGVGAQEADASGAPAPRDDAPAPAAATLPTPPPAPGAATRAEFLRRTRGETAPGATAEPFRVETAPSPNARARYSPLVRRSVDQRGPSADDAPPADGPLPPLSRLSLLPGTVIPAVLVTGLNSDLPGDVVAQVSRDVFDSASLRYVLVPKGTRLVGTYDDQIAYGQGRALVAWTQMVFPDGRVVELPGLPGVDLQGASGLQDRTDRHLGRVFGAAVALAAVGTGLELATPDTDGLDLSPQAVGSAQVAIELSRVATQVLRRELDVQPTISVRPGYRLLVFLAREMQFDGPYTPVPDVGRFRRYAPSRRQP